MSTKSVSELTQGQASEGIDWVIIGEIGQLLPTDEGISELIRTHIRGLWDLLHTPINPETISARSIRPAAWSMASFKVEQFVLEVLLARRARDQRRVAELVKLFIDETEAFPLRQSMDAEELAHCAKTASAVVQVISDLSSARRYEAPSSASTSAPACEPMTRPRLTPRIASPLHLDVDESEPGTAAAGIPRRYEQQGELSCQSLLSQAQAAQLCGDTLLVREYINAILEMPAFRYSGTVFLAQFQELLERQSSDTTSSPPFSEMAAGAPTASCSVYTAATSQSAMKPFTDRTPCDPHRIVEVRGRNRVIVRDSERENLPPSPIEELSAAAAPQAYSYTPEQMARASTLADQAFRAIETCDCSTIFAILRDIQSNPQVLACFQQYWSPLYQDMSNLSLAVESSMDTRESR